MRNRSASTAGLPGRQKGIVLLILFMMLFMAGASVFLTLMNNNVIDSQKNTDTVTALRDARDALISYAVLYGDYYGSAGAGPGHLPCPDTNNDGDENAPCNSAILSRLPQSITLPSGDVLPLSSEQAGLDQQLWYAVSPEFRRSPAGIVNTSVSGSFMVDGRTGMAAVIIAPGEALLSQSRPSNNVSNYLEAANTSAPNFISNFPANPENFNDRIIGITASEILSPTTARVAETIKQALDAYHGANGNYPPDNAEFSAAIATAPVWFAANNWDSITTYTQVTADTATVVFTGCAITYTLDQAASNITRTGTQC